MCGLVGAVTGRDALPVLMEGLKRLEYRGYDSAGIALLNSGKGGGNVLTVKRCVGKVSELETALDGRSLTAALGIGHTRWATHGEPSERNAHPHVSQGTVAVVHNGIIENHESLRNMLGQNGYEFTSDTDTEVIAHLVHYYLKSSTSLFEAVQVSVRDLSGAYAIAVMAASKPDVMVVARRGSPLVLGVAEGEQFVASDATALLPYTKRFIFLEEGDVAEIKRDDINIVDAVGKPVVRELKTLELNPDVAEKAPYKHYMLKEIFEQPQVLADTLEGRNAYGSVLEDSLGFKARGLIDKVRSVHIAACGSSFHAAEVARYWIESLAGVPCVAELASEYRHRSPVVPPDCLFVTLSQSGETADTLAALRHAKGAGYLATMTVCNVAGSPLVRESDLVLLTRAGVEIGVASTKVFTAQLLSMLMFTTLLARRAWSGKTRETALVKQMKRVGVHVAAVLAMNDEIARVAERLVQRDNALLVGRGVMYPIAKEGALKLKEVAYLHAEAHAAGEIKHGPLALIDSDMAVVVLAPAGGALDIKSSLQEIDARGGERVVFAAPDAQIEEAAGLTLVKMPRADEHVAPIVYAVALQLLAYHVAALRGTDVDHPRNLAKAVRAD